MGCLDSGRIANPERSFDSLGKFALSKQATCKMWWWRALFTINNASPKRHVEIYSIIDDDRRKILQSFSGPCFLLQLLSWTWDKQGSIFPWGSHKRDDIPGTEAMAECLSQEAPPLTAGRTTNPSEQYTICSPTKGTGWQGVVKACSSRTGHCSLHVNKEHL